MESRAERRLSVDLRAVLGEVRVAGEPSDAILYVDGASRGPANQTMSLSTAPHVFEVRKPGLEPFRATVTPREGQTQRVEYTLKTAGEARIAGMPPTRTTSLGQPLVLVQGGRFTMGSPRREPGRRSNEAERQVEQLRAQKARAEAPPYPMVLYDANGGTVTVQSAQERDQLEGHWEETPPEPQP